MHDIKPDTVLAVNAKFVGGDHVTQEFVHHSSAQRTYSDVVISDALSKQYPGLNITLISVNGAGGPCDLLRFAASGSAAAQPVEDNTACTLSMRYYVPPLRRMDGDATGAMADKVVFAKYSYAYKGGDYILYVSSGRDPPFQLNTQFLIGASQDVADELIREATRWSAELHNEIYVFDGGYWQKSAELYHSVAKASWDDVILDDDMKHDIRNDVMRFFASRERYERLRVPWKRGVIYYGPPGNGKTVSIKAMMHSLDDLPHPVPTLYVRSLASFGGPEYSIKRIFSLARQQAPCLLVFEDLDSLVRDNSRSYFLNEVDGLQTNEGVMMIGSTNYLERLDPGISKRPSRFDRKYLFPKPSLAQRTQYCDYWRHKLAGNKDIEFPAALSGAIAKITDEFSFAYLQEAFIASLLAIANREDDEEAPGPSVSDWLLFGRKDGKDEPDLEKLILWKEMKKQIKILREEI